LQAVVGQAWFYRFGVDRPTQQRGCGQGRFLVQRGWMNAGSWSKNTMKIRHVKKYFHGIQYHPEMKGSASLKSVLPDFAPNLSYADLATADGETTSLMYLKTLKNELPEEEKKRIYKAISGS
ncbi:MAG: hypothetical protein WAO07_07070, partial [Desulfobacterales bacterium]